MLLHPFHLGSCSGNRQNERHSPLLRPLISAALTEQSSGMRLPFRLQANRNAQQRGQAQACMLSHRTGPGIFSLLPRRRRVLDE
jgi:hypothetical protein